MVKALQARVVALEEQNAGYQRKLMEVHKGAEPARLQLASLLQESRGANEPRPMRLANPSGGELQPADNWSGMYWGASFGAGATVASHSAVIDFGQGNTSLVSGEDTNSGAVIDLFLGVNSRVRPRLVAGLQLEGSLTSLNFDAHGIFTSTSGDKQNFTAQAEATWMASALARVGWLVGPDTMLYGLAGWTFAHFDTDNNFIQINEFDANGPSVGVGIERKMGPDWSVRAEYRFTDFGKTDVTVNQPFAGENRFDDKMHIGRIGIVRKLGRSEPSGKALK